MNHIGAMKQWAEGVSKAYELTAWGHTERAAEILRQTRDSIRTAIEQEKSMPITDDNGKAIMPQFRVIETKKIAECLAVLRPLVKGKWPHEQALEELASYIAPPPRQPDLACLSKTDQCETQTTLCSASETQKQAQPVGDAYLCDKCQTPFDGEYYCPSCGHNTATKEPVYTAPPPRQPWVGLTLNEIQEMKDEGIFLANCEAITEVIEAKLMEKNK